MTDFAVTQPSPHQPNYRHCSYMEAAIRPERIRAAIAAARFILAEYQFEAFAFRGYSGTLFGAPFALAFNKTMLLVRKKLDGHSDIYVEGDMAAKRYVIIDDFISTGDTVKEIVGRVAEAAPEAKCIGVLEIFSVLNPFHYSVPLITSPFEWEFTRKINRLTTIEEDVLRLAEERYAKVTRTPCSAFPPVPEAQAGAVQAAPDSPQQPEYYNRTAVAGLAESLLLP